MTCFDCCRGATLFALARRDILLSSRPDIVFVLAGRSSFCFESAPGHGVRAASSFHLGQVRPTSVSVWAGSYQHKQMHMVSCVLVGVYLTKTRVCVSMCVCACVWLNVYV